LEESGVVKKLCQDAGIEGNFTNHSLRATMATRGLVKGIPDKLIMAKTGHKDVSRYSSIGDLA
jgi:integrase